MFLGAGSFGTALSHALSDKKHEITIWDRKKETVDEINAHHTNHKYLPEIRLSENIRATGDLSLVNDADFLVLSVPSSAAREMCAKIKDNLRQDTVIVSLAKGIDPLTLKTMSEVIRDELGRDAVILSGPSHAEEVALNLPTAVVVSSHDEIAMRNVQECFSTDSFRIYLNSDVTGVETGSAVKNIIALAAGISDGIGFGDNTKAALMTRGMAEIIRMGVALGAREDTFYGLTGMGDLIVTCTSMHSRNRRCGILIGQGKTPEEAVKEVGMVVEGIKACKSYFELSAKMGVEMPITESIHRILFMDADPEETALDLMTRDLKRE